MNAADRYTTTGIDKLSPVPVMSLHVAIVLSPQLTLGDETLRLVGFKGSESISSNFEFELELHGNTQSAWDSPILMSDVVGRSVTVGIQVPALGADGQPPSREVASARFQQALQPGHVPEGVALFNGMVASFAVEQPGVYRITMRPALWKLTLTNAYRVHQRHSVRDAITHLMRRHHINFSVDALQGSDNPAVTRVQDWLQAGESDDEFLQRLMAKAHVYYFFVHKGDSHQVVFANRPAYPEALADARPLRYCDSDLDENALQQFDLITRYRFEKRLASGTVDAFITRQESASEADAVAQFHSYRATPSLPEPALPFLCLQITQYGGSEAEAHELASLTRQSLAATAGEFSGESQCAYLRSGHRFRSTALPRALQLPEAVRPELEGRCWVATRVQHEATPEGLYRNEFVAADVAQLVTPFSMQHTQQGSLLGQVVAEPERAPPSDWRYTQTDACAPAINQLADQTASPTTLSAQGVMVRLCTASADEPPVWIKLAAHMQTAPEIGSTVVVSRAQDHSELPEVQSIVDSNASTVIMPSGWTASTNVGSSYSTAYGDSKNIRFGKHSQAQLQAAVAQVEKKYASALFREVSYSVGGTYSWSSADGGAAGLLSQSDSLGSTVSSHTGALSSSKTVFENSDNSSTVSGTASNTTLHLNAVNLSAIGVQSEIGATGSSTRVNATGSSTSVSVLGTSSDVSLAGSTTSVSLKGVNTSIELAGVGIRADIAAARITLEIPSMHITL